jgi:hypothetical protein
METFKITTDETLRETIQHIWKTGATTFVANLYYSGN